jgi:hypothetical protein
MSKSNVIIDKSGNIMNRRSTNKSTESDYGRTKRDPKKGLDSTVQENEIEELQCTICLDVLNGAVETNCGHAFCGKYVSVVGIFNQI